MLFYLPLALALAANPSHASLDNLLDRERRISGVPGLSAAVLRFGKLVYAGGAGEADLENHLPAKANSVYRLGSVTKQFTATIIMQLVHEGKLSLDSKLASLLPDSPPQWGQVTVSQLLSHTSGIPNYTAVPNFLALIRGMVSPAHINDNVAKKPLDFEPGSNWNYSNSGYVILGLIIERIEGRSFDACLHARILTPLHMDETYFSAQDQIVEHRARGYSPVSNKWKNCPFIDMVWPFSAGAMESNVLDLGKWDAALYRDKILGQDGLKQMWTPVKLKSGESRPYGFGWQVYKTNGIAIEAHGGGIPGFATFIERVPSVGLTVIVLTNSDAGDGQAVAEHIADFIQPSLRPIVVRIDDKNLAASAAAQKALETLANGKVESALFSPSMLALLTPTAVSQMKKASDNYGPLISVTLIKSEEVGGKLSRSYSVKYRYATLTGDFVFDPDGRISIGRLHPSERN